MSRIPIKKLRKMIEEVKRNREWLRNNTYVHIRSDGSYGLRFKKAEQPMTTELDKYQNGGK